MKTKIGSGLIGMLLAVLSLGIPCISYADNGGVPSVRQRVKTTSSMFGTGTISVVLAGTAGENCGTKWLLNGADPRDVSKNSAHPTETRLDARRGEFTITFTVGSGCTPPQSCKATVEAGWHTVVTVPFTPAAGLKEVLDFKRVR